MTPVIHALYLTFSTSILRHKSNHLFSHYHSLVLWSWFMKPGESLWIAKEDSILYFCPLIVLVQIGCHSDIIEFYSLFVLEIKLRGLSLPSTLVFYHAFMVSSSNVFPVPVSLQSDPLSNLASEPKELRIRIAVLLTRFWLLIASCLFVL